MHNHLMVTLIKSYDGALREEVLGISRPVRHLLASCKARSGHQRHPSCGNSIAAVAKSVCRAAPSHMASCHSPSGAKTLRVDP